MVINADEIKGFFIGSQGDRKLLCDACHAKADTEESNLTAEDFLIEDNMDEDLLYFCDECRKKL